MLHHRMRRAVAGANGGGGPWTPANMGNIHHWLDGSDLSSMWEEDTRTTPASSGNVVGSWYDKVSGLYWTQPDTAKKPLANAGGDGLTFDGSNDYLAMLRDPGFLWAEGAGISTRIFAISTPTSVVSNRSLIGGWYSQYGISFNFSTNRLETAIGDGTGTTSTLNGPSTIVGLQLAELFLDNPNDTVYNSIDNGSPVSASYSFDLGFSANDLLICTGATTKNFSTSPIYAFVGDIQEIVITEEPTTADRNALISYFNDKYGLSL